MSDPEEKPIPFGVVGCQVVLPIVNDAGAERESMNLLAWDVKDDSPISLIAAVEKVLKSIEGTDWVALSKLFRVERFDAKRFVWDAVPELTKLVRKHFREKATT